MDKFSNAAGRLACLPLFLLAATAAADTNLTVTPATAERELLRGSKIIAQPLAGDAACDATARDDADNLKASGTYTCRPVTDRKMRVEWFPAPVIPPPPATPPVLEDPTPAPPSDMPRPATDPIPAAPSGTGYTDLRVKAYTGSAPPKPASDGVGAFRLSCGYSHMAFDDPIVFPGQPGKSHLHTFFGNTSTNGATTTDSLLAAKKSTCAGGIANLSAYWVPSLVDTATRKALAPFSALFYYKKGYNALTSAQVQVPPNGLRMVTGRSPTATTAPGKYEPYTAVFECWPAGSKTGTPLPKELTIPAACPAGSLLDIELGFQNCWDGKNLDSPDHRSHMAHARSYNPKVCPASHPVPIPTISLNITYKLAGPGSQYRLASDNYAANLPGGYSLHGDVWIVWDEAIKATWVAKCINATMDCHAELLGDGRILY